jgi:hypothetical protein
LTNGKAAVGTLAVADEADAIAAKLSEFGGAAESFTVSKAAAAEIDGTGASPQKS